MFCSKLFISLFGLAVFIVINEARNIGGGGGAQLNAGGAVGGGVDGAAGAGLNADQIAKQAYDLSDEDLGAFVKRLHVENVGAGFKRLGPGLAEAIIGGLPAGAIAGGINGLTDAQLKDIIDNLTSAQRIEIFGDDNVGNLAGDALRATINNLSASKLAKLALAESDAALGTVIANVDNLDLGNAIHRIPSDKLAGLVNGDLVAAAKALPSGGGVNANVGGGGGAVRANVGGAI